MRKKVILQLTSIFRWIQFLYMMDSSLIGKVEKATRYAGEPDRFRFLNFQVTVRGDNGEHVVTYDHGKWSCDSEYFQTHGYDSHTMAVEKVLEGMTESLCNGHSQ